MCSESGQTSQFSMSHPPKNQSHQMQMFYISLDGKFSAKLRLMLFSKYILFQVEHFGIF